MLVSVEELDGLTRRMTVEVPAEEVEHEVQNRLQSLSRKVNIHGFRPGKVPIKVVKRMYGRQVRQEVVGELMQNSFRKALTEQQLRPAGGPTIEPKNLEADGNLEYSATFEVFPEFEVRGLDNLKVERPVAEVTEADIDNMLETLRRQRTLWNEVERGAQKGDRVMLTFEGKIDGADFPGNKGEEVPMVLGEGRLIEDFENALLGLQAGSETEFDILFPEDFTAKEVAGKTAHFSAKVHTVAEPALPEVDEEFAAGFGIAEGGVDGLRKALREHMERELSEGVKKLVKKQIMDGLLEANDILLPQAMVNEEIEHLAERVGLSSSKEHNEEIAEAKTKLFGEEARRRVALGLLMNQVVAANGIKVDNVRVQSKLETIASTYQDSAEAIRSYQQDTEALDSVRALALEEQVVDWLLEHADVTDKPSSFDEVTKPDRVEKASSEE